MSAKTPNKALQPTQKPRLLGAAKLHVMINRMKYITILLLALSKVALAEDIWTRVNISHYFDDWKEYVEGEVPFECKGDFDGDTKLDKAWLVFDSKKRIRVAVQLSSMKQAFLLPEKTFAQYLGSRVGYNKEGSWYALETTKPGSYEAIEGTTKLTSDALTIIKFEGSGQAVFWLNGKQMSIWLGD